MLYAFLLCEAAQAQPPSSLTTSPEDFPKSCISYLTFSRRRLRAVGITHWPISLKISSQIIETELLTKWG